VVAEKGLHDKINLLANELNERKIFSPRGAKWGAKTLGNFLRGHPEARGSDTTTIPGPQPPRSRESHTTTTGEPRTTGARDSDTTTTTAAQPDIPQSVAGAPQVQNPQGNTSGPSQGTVAHSGNTTIPDARPKEYHDTPTDAPQEEMPCIHTTGVVIPQLDNDTVATLLEMAEWWKEQKVAGVQGMTPEPTTRPYFSGEKVNTGIRINKRLLGDALTKARSEGEKIKTGGGLSPLIEHLFWRYLGFDPKYLREDSDA